jgi:hypothetical protein
MKNLLFIFAHLAAISIYDIWKMSKSELIYWGYNADGKGNYNDSASEAASISQFAFWYFYVFFTAFSIFPLQIAIVNILCIIFLHWTGSEDLGFFIFSRWIKLPEKYKETHPSIKILGFEIPKNLSWLSRSRKVWIVTIPSLIGFVCGKEVEGKRFVLFAVSMIIIVVILQTIIS